VKQTSKPRADTCDRTSSINRVIIPVTLNTLTILKCFFSQVMLWQINLQNLWSEEWSHTQINTVNVRKSLSRHGFNNVVCLVGAWYSNTIISSVMCNGVINHYLNKCFLMILSNHNFRNHLDQVLISTTKSLYCLCNILEHIL